MMPYFTVIHTLLYTKRPRIIIATNYPKNKGHDIDKHIK